MWVWNGWGWRFVSLPGQWITTTVVTTVPALPDQTTPTVIHEAPIAVSEYVARIREKCD